MIFPAFLQAALKNEFNITSLLSLKEKRGDFLPPFFSAEKNDPTMVRIEERRGGAFIMKSLYNNARNNATAICAIPHTELIKS